MAHRYSSQGLAPWDEKSRRGPAQPQPSQSVCQSLPAALWLASPPARQPASPPPSDRTRPDKEAGGLAHTGETTCPSILCTAPATILDRPKRASSLPTWYCMLTGIKFQVARQPTTEVLCAVQHGPRPLLLLVLLGCLPPSTTTTTSSYLQHLQLGAARIAAELRSDHAPVSCLSLRTTYLRPDQKETPT